MNKYLKTGIKLIATIAVLVSLSGCTDKDNAYRILTKEGYTSIIFRGYGFYSCLEGEAFRTNFTAMKNGKPYEGNVCRSLTSGSVIRIR